MFRDVWSIKEGRKTLYTILIGFLITVLCVMLQPINRIFFYLSIGGMIICTFGAENFTRVIAYLRAVEESEDDE